MMEKIIVLVYKHHVLYAAKIDGFTCVFSRISVGFLLSLCYKKRLFSAKIISKNQPKFDDFRNDFRLKLQHVLQCVLHRYLMLKSKFILL